MNICLHLYHSFSHQISQSTIGDQICHKQLPKVNLRFILLFYKNLFVKNYIIFSDAIDLSNPFFTLSNRTVQCGMPVNKVIIKP